MTSEIQNAKNYINSILAWGLWRPRDLELSVAATDEPCGTSDYKYLFPL